jgi:hypothetical protein
MKQPVIDNQNRIAGARVAARGANRLVGRGACGAADPCGVFSTEPTPSDSILLEMPTVLAAYVCRQRLRED